MINIVKNELEFAEDIMNMLENKVAKLQEKLNCFKEL